MTRSVEAALLLGAAVLAGFGVTLVNLASGGSVDAQAGITFFMFAVAFGGLHLAVRRLAPAATTLLLPPLALLTAVAFVEIYRLDPYRAGLQRWWLLIGAGAAALTLRLLRGGGVTVLRRFRYLFAAAALALFALPMLPTTLRPIHGLEVNGSRLWVVVDLFLTDLHFQPGEVAKVAFVVFLASYLADRQASLSAARRHLGRLTFPEPRELFPMGIMWVASLLMLVYERDLGASLLLFAVFVALLYTATAEPGYVTVGGALALIGGVASWAVFPYVQRRVVAWLQPFADFQGAGYQIAQGVFAFGSGSLSGSGPGLGRPDLIPNASTDFIFAAVGEEFGFAGTVAVLAAYALLVATGFGIALRSRDRFRKLLAAGLTFTFGFQTFVILAGVLRVLPLTGIALPFMSYGGSALIGNFLLVALLLRISHEEQV